MNLPNRLTLLRLILTVPFVLALTIDWPGSKAAAFLFFLVATLTDYADGHLARRLGLITAFGQLMDPLVDKIMTVAAFICLVSIGVMPAWAVIIIVSREFLITGLRSVAATRGKTLSANQWGKHKTAWQMMTLLYYLGLLAVRDLLGADWYTSLEHRFRIIGYLLLAIVLALTIWSGLTYCFKNREVIGEM